MLDVNLCKQKYIQNCEHNIKLAQLVKIFGCIGDFENFGLKVCNRSNFVLLINGMHLNNRSTEEPLKEKREFTVWWQRISKHRRS